MTSPPHDPADEPADERTLLLNAYVDGEATPDERARVDSDPVMLAEARQLQSLKATVANVTPPTAETRTRLLDAAMAELTGDTGASFPPPAPSSTSPTPPTVASMPPAPARGRRRTRSPWLATAAAVVGVLAVGGAVFAVLQADSGDGDDSASDADMAPALQSRGDEDAAAEAGDAGEATDETQSDAAAAPMDDAEGAEGEESDQAGAADGGGDVSADEAPEGTAPTAIEEQGNSSSSMREIDNEDDLAAWYLDARYGDYNAPGRSARHCQTRIMGEALFRGTRVFVTTDEEHVNALDAEDCQIMLSTPVP